jgi:hypothetical protein
MAFVLIALGFFGAFALLGGLFYLADKAEAADHEKTQAAYAAARPTYGA